MALVRMHAAEDFGPVRGLCVEDESGIRENQMGTSHIGIPLLRSPERPIWYDFDIVKFR